MTEYLLEKSRIVTQAQDERNYHVFYEMLTGLTAEQKQKYGLLTPEKYFYLNQGGNCEIDGKYDSEDFQSLLSAMQVLGFTMDEQDNIFRILASGKSHAQERIGRGCGLLGSTQGRPTRSSRGRCYVPEGTGAAWFHGSRKLCPELYFDESAQPLTSKLPVGLSAAGRRKASPPGSARLLSGDMLSTGCMMTLRLTRFCFSRSAAPRQRVLPPQAAQARHRGR